MQCLDFRGADLISWFLGIARPLFQQRLKACWVSLLSVSDVRGLDSTVGLTREAFATLFVVLYTFSVL